MKMTRYVIVLFCLSFAYQWGSAQDQGTVVFKLKLEGSISEHEKMLDGSTMKMVWKGEKLYVEQNAKQMKMIMVEDPEETLVLIDRMGQKVMMRHKNTAAEEADDEDAAGYDITYTDETRTIAGYPCKKAILKPRKVQNQKQMPFADENRVQFVEIWYTEKLPNYLKGKDLGEGMNSADVMFRDLKGCPLEYKTVTSKVTTTLTVLEINFDPVPDEVFNVSTEGYQEMKLFMNEEE